MKVVYRGKSWKIKALNDHRMVQDSFTIGNHGVMFMGDGEIRKEFAQVRKKRY